MGGIRSGSFLKRFSLAMALALAAATAAFAILQPVKVLPRIKPLPAFDLIDQNHQYVGIPELLGSLNLISIFPSTAPDASMWIEYLIKVREQLDQDREDGDLPVQLITITPDPVHDTPAVLADFVAANNVPDSNWRFLTGSELAVKLAVGTGLEVYYDTRVQDGQAELVYDRTLVLVDENGIIRAKYTFDDKTVDLIRRDVRMLQQEARSSGVGRAAYEAAHLFLCYPR